ncbi:ATP-dependent protease ATPase subunit HslU [Acetobacterium wieringae]|uniref:ATP-dependent protease ATPase subunit ClpY n=2 Tax=Acetobacterium wieringae TaxID=52694 RepID=A0A1F2PDL3_9FIRM|nr:ATP-dependent protease ATPase subunit HslU [Acetobacterium wieringae]OFV69489.1 ATP-dependent protease ATPase subunit ClpY [Acetobacterium wieringae]TYC87150.1 ATP-dependent protease ATPase subunit HslU [Acetobacterium wieringae]UYO64605.1 ATP-dependent protease ATPase subunit HslU [Acetobacterium wieringae]VUZ24645.1 ATP-dependent protease ATPase subunit ClpY [Acetobacterium wieringae]
MKELTPKKIVTELNRYIIGQEAAKKAVAVAIRNRYRRSLLPADLIDEFTPKNIILIGPTGVGKTEIARRMAKLVKAPFIKVEATKFTEVGYVGRDVESMVRDLVNTAIRNVQQEKMKEVYAEAEINANKIILDILVPSKKVKETLKTPFDIFMKPSPPTTPTLSELEGDAEKEQTKKEKREALSKDLAAGRLEDQMIEIEVDDDGSKTIGIMQGMNSDSMSFNMNDILGDFLPQKKKKKNVKISEARKILINQEAQKLIDMDQVNEQGVKDAEQNGIIFIDEIDKIIGNGNNHGPDVSREGVQRDILPIVEGSTVNTKYGPIKTDFILFIGAGAFHVSKISDMIPELQGRFPISVQLDSLTEEDFIQILTHTENSVIKQYQQLIRTEDVNLIFEDEAVRYLAKIAYLQNEEDENIGARRLHTVMEKLLEEISFYASDYEQDDFVIDMNYVERVFNISEKRDNYQKYLL